MGAAGPGICPSCHTTKALNRRGNYPDREAEFVVDDSGAPLGRTVSNIYEGHSALSLHPEGPMLARRKALSALA